MQTLRGARPVAGVPLLRAAAARRRPSRLICSGLLLVALSAALPLAASSSNGVADRCGLLNAYSIAAVSVAGGDGSHQLQQLQHQRIPEDRLFVCQLHKQCIDQRAVCDGHRDCDNNADEALCECSTDDDCVRRPPRRWNRRSVAAATLHTADLSLFGDDVFASARRLGNNASGVGVHHRSQRWRSPSPSLLPQSPQSAAARLPATKGRESRSTSSAQLRLPPGWRFHCTKRVELAMSECTPCPEGKAFTGHQCEDVNECESADDVCDGRGSCLNLDGGYTCVQCAKGYEARVIDRRYFLAADGSLNGDDEESLFSRTTSSAATAAAATVAPPSLPLSLPFDQRPHSNELSGAAHRSNVDRAADHFDPNGPGRSFDLDAAAGTGLGAGGGFQRSSSNWQREPSTRRQSSGQPRHRLEGDQLTAPGRSASTAAAAEDRRRRRREFLRRLFLCDDFDECELDNPCGAGGELCVNHVSGFSCSCPPNHAPHEPRSTAQRHHQRQNAQGNVENDNHDHDDDGDDGDDDSNNNGSDGGAYGGSQTTLRHVSRAGVTQERNAAAGDSSAARSGGGGSSETRSSGVCRAIGGQPLIAIAENRSIVIYNLRSSQHQTTVSVSDHIVDVAAYKDVVFYAFRRQIWEYRLATEYQSLLVDLDADDRAIAAAVEHNRLTPDWPGDDTAAHRRERGSLPPLAPSTPEDSTAIKRLAVDWENKRVYFLTGSAISVVNFFGRGARLVEHRGSVSAIAVDAVARRLFFSEGGSVRRAHLDGGGGRKVIFRALLAVPDANVESGEALAADPNLARLYYIFDRVLYSFGYDGSQPVVMSTAAPYARIEPFEDRLFASYRAYSTGLISMPRVGYTFTRRFTTTAPAAGDAQNARRISNGRQTDGAQTAGNPKRSNVFGVNATAGAFGVRGGGGGDSSERNSERNSGERGGHHGNGDASEVNESESSVTRAGVNGFDEGGGGGDGGGVNTKDVERARRRARASSGSPPRRRPANVVTFYKVRPRAMTIIHEAKFPESQSLRGIAASSASATTGRSLSASLPPMASKESGGSGGGSGGGGGSLATRGVDPAHQADAPASGGGGQPPAAPCFDAASVCASGWCFPLPQDDDQDEDAFETNDYDDNNHYMGATIADDNTAAAAAAAAAAARVHSERARAARAARALGRRCACAPGNAERHPRRHQRREPGDAVDNDDSFTAAAAGAACVRIRLRHFRHLQPDEIAAAAAAAANSGAAGRRNALWPPLLADLPWRRLLSFAASANLATVSVARDPLARDGIACGELVTTMTQLLMLSWAVTNLFRHLFEFHLA